MVFVHVLRLFLSVNKFITANYEWSAIHVCHKNSKSQGHIMITRSGEIEKTQERRQIGKLNFFFFFFRSKMGGEKTQLKTTPNPPQPHREVKK